MFKYIVGCLLFLLFTGYSYGDELNPKLVLQRERGYSDSVWSVAFSPDGQRVVSGSLDNTLKLWDVNSGRLLHTFEGHSAWVGSVAFSPDGQQVVSGSDDNTLKLWDVKSGRLLHTFEEHSFSAPSVAFSPDGQQVVSGSFDELKLWEVKSGRLLHTFEGHSDSVVSVTFSPDGQQVVSGSHDKTLKRWDVKSGRLLHTFEGHSSSVWSVAFSPDGQQIVSGSGDTTMRLWDKQTGEELVKFVGFDDGSGVAATPEGYFVASNGGEKYLHVRVGDRTESLAKYRSQFERPDLVAAKLSGNTNNLAQAPTNLTTPNPSLARRGEKDNNLNSKDNALNSVAVPSRPRDKDCPNTALAPTDKLPFLPNLWILAIGISQYEDADLISLDYAAADAKAIVKAFKCQEQRVFNQVHSKILSDGGDALPTYDNIVNNLNWLKQASSLDIVLLFIAGHGTNSPNGEYFLLPRDAQWERNGKFKESKAISASFFRQKFQQLPDRRIVLADTCYSETLVNYKTRSVPNMSAFINALRDMRPFMFTSARGNERSQERAEWGHGAFTYAILQALYGKGDLLSDGVVTVEELKTYVSGTVPQLTDGEQHPVPFTPEGGVDFPLAVVE